jgi:hypothetical protein
MFLNERHLKLLPHSRHVAPSLKTQKTFQDNSLRKENTSHDRIPLHIFTNYKLDKSITLHSKT